MTTFVIDAQNDITVLGSKQEADGITGESFSSQQELAKLVAPWPGSRLIAIWNRLPGRRPVNKFTDRNTALARIWQAIQSLNRAGALGAVKSTQVAQGKRATIRRKSQPAIARQGSKKAAVITLLRRKGGATLQQIMDATGWQAHSVRGFLSGAVGKKMGLPVESGRRDDGQRSYQIVG